MELALGTAQIGIAYGVNNAVGCPSDSEAAAVLAAAADSGFTMVDTSFDYGLAMSRIGQFLKKRPRAFKVMVKYRGLLLPDAIRERQAYVQETMPVDYTLLWTSGEDVSKLDPALADGVAVHTAEEAEAVPDGFDIIQFPASILDGRMEWDIRRQQRRGRTVIVRSLLLQGLLMTDPEIGPVGHHRSPELSVAARPYLQGIRRIATAHGVGVLEIAVRWVWYFMPDIAVIGAETPEQVLEIAQAWKRGPLPFEIGNEILALRENIPELVISPRMWNQQYHFTGQNQ